MKRYGEALADFSRLIDLDPTDAGAIASLGKTYRLMGRQPSDPQRSAATSATGSYAVDLLERSSTMRCDWRR